MKRLFFLIAVITIFTQCSPANKNSCADIKDGKFRTVVDSIPVFVERNGNRQIERVPSQNVELEFDVQWIDDCKYTLKMTAASAEKYPHFGPNRIVTTEIGNVTETGYTFVSTSNVEGEGVMGGVMSRE